jgi:hypothetical protein
MAPTIKVSAHSRANHRFTVDGKFVGYLKMLRGRWVYIDGATRLPIKGLGDEDLRYATILVETYLTLRDNPNTKLLEWLKS